MNLNKTNTRFKTEIALICDNLLNLLRIGGAHNEGNFYQSKMIRDHQKYRQNGKTLNLEVFNFIS